MASLSLESRTAELEIGHVVSRDVRERLDLDALTERRMEVDNPATGEVCGVVPVAGSEIVHHVVRAAVAAQQRWAQESVMERQRAMFRLREAILARRDRLAEAITREHGKTLADAHAEIDRGVEVVEFASGVPQLLKGEASDNVSRGVDCHAVRRPLGVTLGIAPFNFPVMVPMWMAPLSIACGNAFILKPSERVPSAGAMLAAIAREAGIPDGIFQVVHGDAETVGLLLDHPEIAAVSSVSSTPVAEEIYRRASAAGKRVQALAGAKNHAVVLPDADVESVADAITGAAFGSTGQRCMAVSAVVAVGSVADQLVAALRSRAEAIRVGDGASTDTEMGPLTVEAGLARCAAALAEARDAGAEVVLDGRARTGLPEAGYFVGPSIVDHVTRDMRLWQEEVFGPVLAVVRVASFDEALSTVNASAYGNGASIFTADGGAARRFQREVEAGMVGINVPIPVPFAFHSFGGWKASLFGDQHMHGPEGVRFFTRAQVVTTRWPDPAERTGVDLGFPRT